MNKENKTINMNIENDELLSMTNQQLEERIRELNNNINVHARNHLLREALRNYVLAQSRMLDRWAEGDDKVKNQLWKDLHACEERARILLEAYKTENKTP